VVIRTCPICRKRARKPKKGEEETSSGEHFPFCSERCKMIDLGRWLDEEYTVPGPLSPEDEDDEPTA
jgi:endogenous inhibitor of DNA gyrase (YacG/DUF329 family)